MEENFTHIAYSDESYYTNSKYSSISMISLELKNYEELNKKIKSCLESSDVEEFKWKWTGSAKYRFCANKMIDVIFELANKGVIRVDTIIWDSSKRKKFKAETDVVILGKMYYHLFKNVLMKRWPKSDWKLYPDQQSSIDWKELEKILENCALELKIIKNIEGDLIFNSKRNFKILEICQIDSKESCLCQITDLFSGIAAFYHLECPYCNLGPDQILLNNTKRDMSNKDIERHEIIKHLKEISKKNSIDIIFDFNKGVKTLNPNSPINFWQFEVNPSKYQNQSLSKFF